MTQVKFCKDCRWYQHSYTEPHIVSRCTKKIFYPPSSWNLVTGSHVYIDFYRYCRKERSLDMSFSGCGPEAKYFEKRLTWWDRLKEKLK